MNNLYINEEWYLCIETTICDYEKVLWIEVKKYKVNKDWLFEEVNDN